MQNARWLLLLGALAALACSDESPGSASDEPDAALPDAGGDPGPPPNAVGGFSITLPEVTLEPGEERQPCWILPLEVEGPSRFVAAASLTTGVGLHHGNITTRPKTGEGVRPCEKGVSDEATDVLGGGAVLFGSSTQLVGTEWHRFAPGQAYRVKDGFEVVARMHYLNTSSEALSVAPEYRWYTIAEGDVTEELSPFAWVLSDFEIPPHSETTVSAECWFPEPMKIVDAMPHMHALGTRYFAEYVGGEKDGQAWLDDRGFDEASDIYFFDPAVDLGQGDGVRFGCTWFNTLDKPVYEGVGDDEMCILFGYAYPAGNAYTALQKPAAGGKCVYVQPPAPGD